MTRGITLIEGIDVGHVPPTPTTVYFNSPHLAQVRVNLITQASNYGFPICFAQEQCGALIQNVFPIQKTESQQISTSSKTELGLHTEAAFHPYKPTAVLLLCLRGDPNAVTTYANVDDIVKHLKPATQSILTNLWFTTSIDESFRTNGERDIELPCSVLSEVISKTSDRRAIRINPVYDICYDETLIKGINEQAVVALGELHDAIRQSIKQIVLKTGDLLILNNKTTIHGRLPFQARYDGTDRWVQRILAIETLPPKTHLNGCVITTKFGQH